MKSNDVFAVSVMVIALIFSAAAVDGAGWLMFAGFLILFAGWGTE